MRDAAALDDVDRRILAHLVQDGRATVQAIADTVGLRRPSVHERLKRLEAAKVIQSYHARLDPEAVGQAVVAFVHLQVAHGQGQDCLVSCGGIVQALRDEPRVLEAHTSAGDDDMILKVRAASLRDLQELVLRKISGLPDVRKVRTTMVLSTDFERPVTLAAPTPTKRRPKGALGRTATT